MSSLLKIREGCHKTKVKKLSKIDLKNKLEKM